MEYLGSGRRAIVVVFRGCQDIPPNRSTEQQSEGDLIQLTPDYVYRIAIALASYIIVFTLMLLAGRILVLN